MALDASKNLLSSLVAVAPSPATTGVALGVTPGSGSGFVWPANYVVWPPNVAVSAVNAEIVRVTGPAVADVLPVVRVQEGSPAQAIAVGWQIALGPTAKMFADIQAADAANAAAIVAEAARATGVEGTNSSGIAANATAISTEAMNRAAAVTAEAATARAAETANAAAITAEAATARAAEAGKVPTSALGVTVATLVGGRLPASQLTLDAVEFLGVWNATTNTPTLADGNPDVGAFYRVSVAGTQNLGSGSVTYAVGDDVLLDAGLIWRKIGGGGLTQAVADTLYVHQDGTGLPSSVVSKSLVTAKGDLIAATGNAAITNVAVGADTTVLTADSTQAAGVKWAGAGGATATALGWVDAGAPSGGDDYATLAAKITATPVGGTLYLNGHYKISATLVVNKAMRIVGAGVFELWGAEVTSYLFPSTAPYMAGTYIEVTTAAIDAIQITAGGATVPLEGFGILFTASRWTNTGHGIVVVPPIAGAFFDHGVVASAWKNLLVVGHDGNHYGFDIVNPLFLRTMDLHAYGGGGVRITNNSGAYNYGNSHFDGMYCAVVCGGSADGLRMRIIGSQVLNLMQFSRCQTFTYNYSAAIPAITTPATNAQKTLNCDPTVARVSFVQPDFESNLGSTAVFPQSYFMDPAGLINNLAGSKHDIFRSGSFYDRSLGNDMNFHVRTAGAAVQIGVIDDAAGDTAVKWGYNGNGGRARIGGALPGTIPRQSAVASGDGGLLADKVTSALLYSDGISWSDVAAAPVIGSLGAIAGLILDANVDAMGLTNGAAVASVTDASGSGNALSAAGAAQPTASSTVITPSGKKSMTFDGTTQGMTSPLPCNTASFTDFYVVQTPPDNSFRQILAPSAGGGIQTYLGFNATGAISLNASALIAYSNYNALVGAGQCICLLVVRYDGTTATFRDDATPMGLHAATVPGAFTAGTTKVGNSSWKGAMFRLVRYNVALTDTQMYSVEKFLRVWAGTS
jgi:hypothetical protein